MSVIIVTGAFGVLGRAVVADLAARGHGVAAIDKAAAPADHGAALALGGVDLGDEVAVTAAYAQVAETLGALGGLVNVAGGFVWEPVVEGSLDSWDRMYAINLKTAVVSTRAALTLLATGTAIVNVGAAGATRPGVGMAPYAASKAGVRALTESLAEELKARGIRVNAVLPTIIDTPANRADMPDADTAGWVRPQAAARVIAFLLSDDSGAITGAAIPLSLAG
ncbi:SDR family NAD(P)-dependent oxidoreductase [uncultured Sphingomonas sp.]|uniref:SDR family NAD(P)-dependent oxidoreductase n=1 Tax=uncultured Sphingomonas sp. TaxID=158754 RepID=UPI0026059D2C|nr:SDR family NAD(P)-dependent oxidoreductase [uncultured Sphingomonas sp.]